MESFRNSYLTTDFRYCNYSRSCKDTHIHRILIADKDIGTAKILKKFLMSKGYRIIIVDRWKYLLLEMKRKDLSILFMDIKLLDAKGYKLVPIIKKIRPDIYIIITNNSNSMKIESLVRDCNIFFYCLKPYDMYEISLLVKNILDRHE